MISGFRQVEFEYHSASLSEKFVNKLIEDMHQNIDGYIYAFLNNDKYGVSGKYTKLKVDKHKHNLYFKIDGERMLSTTDIFDGAENETYPCGYCVNEHDANIVQTIRTKDVLDEYCEYAGFHNMENFVKTFNKLKDVYPEKLV